MTKADEPCNEHAGHLIAGASWFACVLPKGHAPSDHPDGVGGHLRGGECFKHGKYTGRNCPQHPDCAKADESADAGGLPEEPIYEEFSCDRGEGDHTEIFVKLDDYNDLRTAALAKIEQLQHDLSAALRHIERDDREIEQLQRERDKYKDWHDRLHAQFVEMRGRWQRTADRLAQVEAERRWKPMGNAPKGGGAELVTDPAWIDPPRILMRFGEEGIAIAHWDWYYAEGGNGCTDSFAWIEPFTGEPLNLHFTTPPDGWQPLPLPPGGKDG